MPTYDLQYPKQPYSTVKRYDTRASYSLKTIHTIVSTSPILHVSFTDPSTPFPVTLPMIGALGSFTRPSADITDVQDLYLHGYISSRLINLSRSSTPGNDTAQTSPEGPVGLPLTITATHLDGLVLSLTPNSHSYNYRSATLFGHATLVSDTEEKLFAMEKITNGVVPGRWQSTRTPPNKGEMASTSVLKVKISAGSAKIRTGGPGDDKADLEDEELKNRVWTGVLPVWTEIGEGVAGGYNKLEGLPADVEEWRREGNEERRRHAVEGASSAPGKLKTDEE
ncbi:hypothetical protein DL546_008731 [Coniochaeta pulveracea]|uniref:Flavin-nucleotide-binding protein n=1 Tax=Coniochaeta pulveracea TaxID=177199 RepID=A0A420YMZ0_9PEZI|nr:hypothetical protein DL546_008731 [Coniochaeta pulveracea]